MTVNLVKEHKLPRERDAYKPQTIVRRAEPEDLEAQIKALKVLQQRLGYSAKKPLAKKKEGFVTTFKNNLSNIMHGFFRSKQKPKPASNKKRYYGEH